MNVGGDEVERPSASEFPCYAVYGFAVGRTQAGINHERGVIADDITDVWYHRNAVIRDDVDVVRDLSEPLNPDEWCRPGLCRKRRRGSQECERREEDPEMHGTIHCLM
jgi:hypothetical protein